MQLPGEPILDLLDRRAYFAGRAMDLFRSLGKSNPETLYEGFVDDPSAYGNGTRWQPAANSTGTQTTGGEVGGSIIYASTSTGSRKSEIAPANTFFGNLRTKGWYMGGRLKFPVAVDNVATLFFGVTDGSNTVGLGLIGSISTTNIVLQHSANLITNGTTVIPLDTSYHTFELIGAGDGSIRGRADDGAWVTVTPTVTYLTGKILITARNGATAADRQLQIDDLFCAAER